MDWYRIVFELIDMRSFSNLWFWIGVAVVWSSASHFVLGVPWDLVLRARRKGGQAAVDLEDLVRINTNRLLYIARVSGLWLLGMVCFLLTMLGLLGFRYGIEFAQAVFLLAFPMSFVALFSLSTARLIRERGATGEDLHRYLFRQRLITQGIGMISIFVTALWAMLTSLTVPLSM